MVKPSLPIPSHVQRRGISRWGVSVCERERERDRETEREAETRRSRERRKPRLTRRERERNQKETGRERHRQRQRDRERGERELVKRTVALIPFQLTPCGTLMHKGSSVSQSD